MNWDSICYVLKSFGIEETKRDRFNAAYRILLLDEYVLDEANTLYICLDNSMEQSFDKSLIISIGGCEVKASNYIKLSGGSPASVFNALMQPDSNLKTLGDLLNGASSEQEIIDIASSYLGCPFFYFDESYRVLAITNMKLENDPEWKYMTEQRFLSPESIKLMQDSGDLDMLADSDEPVIYDADFFPFVSIVTNIKYHDKPYARLNRLSLNGKANPVMQEECAIVARNLYRLISTRSVLPMSGSADHMIIDMLNGIRLPEALIRERMRHRYNLTDRLLRLCVIDVNTGSDVHVPSYYSTLIGRIYEGDKAVNLIYENNILLLIQAETETGFEPAMSKLKNFLSKQDLRAGISSIFMHFNEVKIYYGQAYAALGYADPADAVSFEDVMADYMISFIPDGERELFAPYALTKLASKQDDFSFPLVETLRTYLECGCSLKKSSEALFIHKNTMLYRINKIREVMGEDLEDPYSRMIIMLALKIVAL